MANFEFKEAKHQLKLREVKDNTSIRDFLAAIQAYHDTLSAVGNPLLIAFVINAKVLGSAKTKHGDGQGCATITDLKALLHERCGNCSRRSFNARKERKKNGDNCN
jgi:hypothetical protein